MESIPEDVNEQQVSPDHPKSSSIDEGEQRLRAGSRRSRNGPSASQQQTMMEMLSMTSPLKYNETIEQSEEEELVADSTPESIPIVSRMQAVPMNSSANSSANVKDAEAEFEQPLPQCPTPLAMEHMDSPYGDIQDSNESETLRQIVNAASIVAKPSRDVTNKREAFFDPLPKPETFFTNYNRSIA